MLKYGFSIVTIQLQLFMRSMRSGTIGTQEKIISLQENRSISRLKTIIKDKYLKEILQMAIHYSFILDNQENIKHGICISK